MHYLFSSFTGIPDRYFEGYCFLGDDYIFGNEGMERYCQAHGQEVPAGEDGCYLTIRKVRDGHEVGTDYCGYKKVFYFSDGNVWGISNSIVALARHLRHNGVRLSINYPQLSALKNPSPITFQMCCFETIFNEVSLLPSYTNLVVTEGRIAVRDTEPGGSTKSYAECLQDFTNAWVRRFETLLRDRRVSIRVDLSGGKDSRTVFAFLERARERCGKEAVASVTVRSDTGKRLRHDYEAATKVAKWRGVALNKAVRGRARRLGAHESYDGWKNLNLGVYHPIYFPQSAPYPFDVHFHGGGAEKYKPFYALCEPTEYVANEVVDHWPGFLCADWKSQFLASLEAVSRRNAAMHPMIMHYREFRNRMHAGRGPQYKVVICPLASKLLEPASVYKDKIETSQIFYDVMESLVPGLSRVAYDHREKMPSKDNLRAITRIEIDRSESVGHVYGEESPGSSMKADGGEQESCLDLLNEEYGNSRTQYVRELFGKDLIARNDDVMKKAVANRAFAQARDARDISRVIATAVAFEVGGING